MQTQETIPVMILPNANLFPKSMLPLLVFESRYRQMLQQVLDGNRLMGVSLTRIVPSNQEEPHPICGLGMIRAAVTHDDGTSHLILEGLKRVELIEAVGDQPWPVYRFRECKTIRNNEIQLHALKQKLIDEIHRHPAIQHLSDHGEAKSEGAVGDPEASNPIASPAEAKAEFSAKVALLLKNLTEMQDIELMCDMVASTMIGSAHSRQRVLNELELDKRLNQLITLLTRRSQPSSFGDDFDL
ncbi:MAG: LON peptidase substrate-binding domain-containing protein [Limisphaerales bacterium]